MKIYERFLTRKVKNQYPSSRSTRLTDGTPLELVRIMPLYANSAKGILSTPAAHEDLIYTGSRNRYSVHSTQTPYTCTFTCSTSPLLI